MPDEEPITDMAEAIRAHGLASGEIALLLGNDNDTYRWYGATLEQGATLPAVTVQQISGVDAGETHQGHSGLERERYQITIWSGCRQKLVHLTWAINRQFHAFRGRLGGPGGLMVQRVAKLNQVDMGRNGPRDAYQRALDFVFEYRPPL
jgi:hypothetical protein